MIIFQIKLKIVENQKKKMKKKTNSEIIEEKVRDYNEYISIKR